MRRAVRLPKRLGSAAANLRSSSRPPVLRPSWRWSATRSVCTAQFRIVRADGSLAKGERQRRLLEAEGVPFRGPRVDMDVAWVPVEDPG